MWIRDRFGVAHKEKIKQLKQNVDVLTLTATPIPRTLHMSLIGIRDMSVLEEPPMERVPIQTYVMEYNDEMVREAVSYTHLDVYKRQGYACATSWILFIIIMIMTLILFATSKKWVYYDN